MCLLAAVRACGPLQGWGWCKRMCDSLGSWHSTVAERCSPSKTRSVLCARCGQQQLVQIARGVEQAHLS